MTEIIVKIIFNTLKFLNLLNLIFVQVVRLALMVTKSAIQDRLPSNWIDSTS